LDSYKISPKQEDLIIDAEIENINTYIPKPEEICNEIYRVFTYLNSNPFLKDDNYDLKSIINRYNWMQLRKKE
jgi:hypothetical protein